MSDELIIEEYFDHLKQIPRSGIFDSGPIKDLMFRMMMYLESVEFKETEDGTTQ